MPTDPLQHVSPGTPLMEAVTAEVLNALKDAARDVRGERLPGPSGGASSKDLVGSLTVLIRNDTGGDLASGSILKITGKIGDVVNSPIPYRKRPVLTGDVPDDPQNPIAILHEPILTDGIGRAAIAGICVCYVSINDAGHEYAAPIVGDETALESVAFGGPARILWKESSGAVRVAIVMLGESGSITVAEEDGTPSVNVSTLKFPNTSLTDNGDGTVSVGLADGDSAAKAGLVSASQQYLAGTKYIVGNVYSANNSSASKTAEIALKSISGNPRVEAASDPITDGPISLYFLNTPAQPEIVLDCPSVILVPPRITIRQAGIDYAGVTGTGGGGDHYTGGICDTLGSGPSAIDGGTWT